MQTINNPILRGFNPDPSIIRVKDDYYIATSTFEWFPGVQIYHSKDLVNWELAVRPLNRLSQLDMRGNPCSGGVWAPCLSYDNGIFYLVYTDVKTRSGIWKDAHNYLVTTDDIYGDWSEPIYLNSSGFDPSLFHDTDGRKWIVNMLWEHRLRVTKKSNGIIMQEYSPERKKLVGPVKKIFDGVLSVTEGPHLYKRNGYYYLIVAEGGTGYNHVVTLARSKKIDGPYEVHPLNPILTSADNPELELQKAGHADLVKTQTGEWYMVYLCARPLSKRGYCPLGRETAIQKVVWKDDDWLYLENGGNTPDLKVPAPDFDNNFAADSIVTKADNQYVERDEFDSFKLNINYQFLRVPLNEDLLSLKERPGFLRLKGSESLSSRFRQSLIARRWQSFNFTATTCLEYEPKNYQQMAGLVCLYDESDFYYLMVTHNEEMGKCLDILCCNQGQFTTPLEKEVRIEGWNRVYLRVEVDREELQFYYSQDEDRWQKIGLVLDVAKLSDAISLHTGSFVGLCCQDITGQNHYADFDFFEYKER